MSSDEKNRFPLIPVSCPADFDFESNLAATYGIEAKLFSNVCIRSLNSIYYNAPRIRPGDESDFAGYCLTSFGAICGQHEHGVEKILYPVLQKKYDMTPFIQQHVSCRARINTLSDYLRTVVAKGPYDGQKVRESLNSFGDELVQTYHEGVKNMDSERLKEYDQNEVNEMIKAHIALVQKLIDETPTPIFTITHHDLKTAPSWPPQAKHTGPVDKLKIFADTQGYWKFAPYSVKHDGEPQTYA